MNTFTYINDIDDLVDVLDDIKQDDIPYDKPEFIEYLLHLMDEYITKNPKAVTDPDFHEEFVANVQEMTVIQFGHGLWEQERWEMEDVIQEAMELFYETIMPIRSHNESIIVHELTQEQQAQMTQQIQYLQSIPQPEQRTPEWYAFRHTLITASNAYKAFENESTRNQLIWEKCQPLTLSNVLHCNNDCNNDEIINPNPNIDNKIINITPTQNNLTSFAQVNVNTPMHHGQKYEPVSVMIYEDMYNTKVGEFGCIRDRKYSFLGASPDGINVDPTNPRFGRMLEIKNVTTREIDGVPKLEYWIQMQLQMRVCDLRECDFLETKFVEYESAEEYWSQDHDSNGDADTDDDTECTKNLPEYKGIIMYFTNPHTYEYAPLSISNDQEAFEKWEEEKMEQHKNKVWIKNCYWKTACISCVLVEYNSRWFEDNIGELANVWSIIKKERNTGYEHRAPNKRSTNTNTNTNTNTTGKHSSGNPIQSSGCLLKINKETGQAGLMTKQDHVVKVFKIRTESFDEVKEKEHVF